MAMMKAVRMHAFGDVDVLHYEEVELTYQEAAAVPMAALIAWQALFDTAQLRAGQTVLIPGGAGGVGHLAIQLAK